MTPIKIWRSPDSEFGVWSATASDLNDETVTAEKIYTDEELKKIAASGFNAIWIHGQLHNFIPSKYFSEFAPNSAIHQTALHTLIERAAKYNIKVYIYMQPPRAIAADAEFLEKYKDCIGFTDTAVGDDGKQITYSTLCTSVKYVRDYIQDSFATLAETFPDLGGIIIISASEYPAHCYCRANIKNNSTRKRKLKMDFVPTPCPRCGEREPEEVVIELLNTIRNGVRSVSNDMKIIFWNWSWSMYIDPPCAEIIEKLPHDCILMADFERGGYREDGTFINEYSLSYAGPSEQFRDSMQCAKRNNVSILAKLQLGTTHELATVCSLPLIHSIYRKIRFIRENDIKGFMGCWNFGNQQSANTAAANYFFEVPLNITENDAVKQFAAYYFPGCDAEKTAKAWELFYKTMSVFPFNVPFIYDGVLNHAIGLLPPPGPVSGKIVGRSWLPDERGDDYRHSVTEEYRLDAIIERMSSIANNWQQAMKLLNEGIGSLNDEHSKIEYGNAVIVGCIWAATANLYKIYKLKLNWNDDSMPEYNKLAGTAKDIIRTALPYVKQDPRQGFHIEGRFYSFNAEIMEAILNS